MSGLSPADAQRFALLLVLGELQDGQQDDYAHKAVARLLGKSDEGAAADVIAAAVEMLAAGLRRFAEMPPAEVAKLAIGLLELRGEPVDLWTVR